MAFHRNTLLLLLYYPHLSTSPALRWPSRPDSRTGETQRMWTEVSLYGESLGLFETDINLETVSFVAPETVVAAIKRQFNDDPALIGSVSAALAVPLARNGNRLQQQRLRDGV